MDKLIKHHIHELAKNLPPTILTIFGATGDLALRYLLPTLIHMDMAGLLPGNFRLVCVGRRNFTKQQFLKFFLDNAKSPTVLREQMSHFAQHVEYFRGDFERPKSFRALSQQLQDKDINANKHLCYNRLYYFATAPSYFSHIARILKREGLLVGCTDHKRTIRVLVEKPFGHDLQSAKDLNKLLLQFFQEQQIYRIDHYLGKETVQNLMVMRFANDFLEPIWNAKYIDHVEISVLESGGVENRAPYYDKAGALKDMVQNHMLQILALMAMDKPKDLGPESIRNQKVKVLKALKLFSAKTVSKFVVRGQYRKSGKLPGYVQEVGHRTDTETFVAMKTFVSLARWKGVPFYLRTGKRLPRKITEISVHFKQQGHNVFAGRHPEPNILTFRIQPREKIKLRINNKIPGFGIHLRAGSLKFGYGAFDVEIPGAYERLLLDFMEGDQRLFIRSDEIESAWKFIDSIKTRRCILTQRGRRGRRRLRN
jgi:glucose-6-phosphate 1-dehydrogenase